MVLVQVARVGVQIARKLFVETARGPGLRAGGTLVRSRAIRHTSGRKAGRFGRRIVGLTASGVASGIKTLMEAPDSPGNAIQAFWKVKRFRAQVQD